MIQAMAPNRGGLRSYFSDSRDLFTSLVLVMPLFFVYQLGILATGGLRNGVDFVSNVLFLVFDGNALAYVGFDFLVLVAFAVALGVLRKRGQFEPRRMPWMLLESAVYALLLGSVVIAMMSAIGLDGLLAAGAKPHAMTLVDKLVMSAGAGLYEEIVFRLLLMGGMILALTRVVSLPTIVAVPIAIVVSSVLFSAAHYIAEPFAMSSFIFRIFAGILFAIIFRARGLAVAAYTHCLYDVWVMVVHGA